MYVYELVYYRESYLGHIGFDYYTHGFPDEKTYVVKWSWPTSCILRVIGYPLTYRIYCTRVPSHSFKSKT